MKQHILRLLTALALLVAAPAHAATYYVDFDNGSDSNAGTSKGAPWRTLPGTRNAGTQASPSPKAWGSVTTSAKIGSGDLIKMRQGTTYSAADGFGLPWIDTDYYTDGLTATNSIVIEVDETWDSGGVTIAAGGLSGGGSGTIAGFLIRVDGVTLRGNSSTNLYLGGSTNSMVHVKERAGDSSAIRSFSMSYCVVTNVGSGLLTDPAASSIGAITVRRGDGIYIDHCFLDNISAVGGSGGFANGIVIGESTWEAINYVIAYVWVQNFKGSTAANEDDAGIAFKIFNPRGTLRDSVAKNCLKGMDIGEQNIGTAFQGRTYTYNMTFMSNVWGANFNWSGLSASRTNFTENFFWNNLILSNRWKGQNIYAGPMKTYRFHNIYAYNSPAAGATDERPDVMIGHNNTVNEDGGAVGIYDWSRNNIHFRPGAVVYIMGGYYNNTNKNITLDSDYNVYVQGSISAYFAHIAYFTSGEAANISWGSPWTPGDPLQQWYLWYTKWAHAPAGGGTGHFHSDDNSTILLTANGRNSDSFFNNFDQLIPSQFDTGLDISSQPWFTAEMGKDRFGNTRTVWRAGAYEQATPPPVGGRTFYVATNGNATNSGTFAQPWTLNKAFTYQLYGPGDTVELLDGTYSGPLTDGRTNAFVFQAQAGAGNTVTWRPFRGSRAIIDACRIQASSLSGFHMFQNLEWTTLYKTNHLSDANERWQLWDGSGLDNLQFVNNLLYDVPQAWGNTTKELRGNVVLYGGATSFEHGWYGGGGANNRLIGNLFHSSAGEPIKFAPTSDVTSASFLTNIVINPGFLASPTGPNYGAVFGPGSIYTANVNFDDNYLLVDPLYPNSFTDNPILHPGNASTAMSDWRFRRNYILGPDITTVKFGTGSSGRITNLVFTGNVVANKNAGSAVDRSIWYSFATQPTPTVNSNAYYNAGGSTARFQYPDGTATTSFSTWTNTTGFDIQSTFTGNSYPPNVLKVLPNMDEAGRGHVLSVNHSGLSSVAVDLAPLQLSVNRQILLMSSQSVNNKAGWKTNVWTGTPLSFSMDPNDWPISQPRTFADYQAPSNGLPRFGAWIVIPAPLRPTAIAAAPNGASNQVNVAWQTSGSDFHTVLVQRKSGAGAWTQVASLSYTATNWVDTDVATGGTFLYRVLAANSYVDSGPSAEASAIIGIAAPTGLSVAITGPSSALLTWADNASNETMYVLERKIGAGGTYGEVAILSANSAAFQEFQLSPITTYYWRVRARTATLVSDYSNEATGTTTGLPPPPPVTAAIPPRFKRASQEPFLLP